MTTDAERTAREILNELEERLATHDHGSMVAFFTDDVVLIGDGEENFDRESTEAYLQVMADMEPTVRWDWDRVEVVLDTPENLGFAAAGTMAFHHSSGQQLGDPERFRVTCLAVHTPAGWRLRHFHGSEPQG